MKNAEIQHHHLRETVLSCPDSWERGLDQVMSGLMTRRFAIRDDVSH
jgi:hypothetical protein